MDKIWQIYREIYIYTYILHLPLLYRPTQVTTLGSSLFRRRQDQRYPSGRYCILRQRMPGEFCGVPSCGFEADDQFPLISQIALSPWDATVPDMHGLSRTAPYLGYRQQAQSLTIAMPSPVLPSVYVAVEAKEEVRIMAGNIMSGTRGLPRQRGCIAVQSLFFPSYSSFPSPPPSSVHQLPSK